MFATLWYKGVAMVWIGFAGMPIDTCTKITAIMEYDVSAAYSNPESAAILLSDGFEQQYWTTSCEHTPPVKDG